MSDNFLLRIFRARASARSGRRVALCVNSLMRYAILGAVALSILPPSALAGFQIQPAQTQEDQSGDKAARPVKINTRVFRELLSQARRLRDEGAIDLSGALSLDIEADRNDDGTIENISITGATPDNVALKALAEDFVRALGESRALSFLEGARRLRMALRLDAANVYANFSGELESTARASELARGYGMLLAAARIARRGGHMEAVYNNMTVSANGKQLALKLEMSREEAGNLLLKQITPN